MGATTKAAALSADIPHELRQGALMEIGPIPGIRSIQPVPSNRTADLSGVFRVEFQREQQERYTPHAETSERGLEDESAEEDGLEEASVRANPDESGDRQVSFFA